MLRRRRVFCGASCRVSSPKKPLTSATDGWQEKTPLTGLKKLSPCASGGHHTCVFIGLSSMERALRRKKCTIPGGLLSPRKEVRSQSEERRGSGSRGKFGTPKTPPRPYEVAVSDTRDKQQAVKDRAVPRMPPGCDPPLSAGFRARTAPWESRARERRTIMGQGSSEIELLSASDT